MYLLSMDASELQQQSCILATETTWPARPSILTIWPLIKTFADPCSRLRTTPTCCGPLEMFSRLSTFHYIHLQDPSPSINRYRLG